MTPDEYRKINCLRSVDITGKKSEVLWDINI